MKKISILLLISLCLGTGCAVTVSDIKRWGEERDTKKIEPLMALLDDKNPAISKAAIQALGDVGAPVVDPLINAIKLEASCVRGNKSKALGKISDPQAVNPLVTALRGEGACIRAAIAFSLVNIGEASVKPLIDVLRDDSLDVRQSAAGVLGKLDWEPKNDLDKAYYVIATESWDEIKKWDKLDAAAVGAFVDALKYGRIDRNVKSVLTRMGKSAVDPLITKLKNAQIRRTAAWILSKIGAPAVKGLIPALQDGHLRQPIAWILSEIGAPAVKPLIVALKDVRFRQAAAEALIRIGRPAAKALIATLGDEDPRLRSAAAQALGKIGDRRAIEPLAVIAREDNDMGVRRTAVRALEKIRW